MKFHSTLALLGLGTALSGCAFFGYNGPTDPLKDPFADSLRSGYIELGNSEGRQGDIKDTLHYRHRAAAVAPGAAPEPTTLEKRRIPANRVKELTDARKELVDLFGKGARKHAPFTAARAQLMFDCWVEQQEENIQPDDIAACRESFFIALRNLKNEMGQPSHAFVVRENDTSFLVFFDLDSIALGEAKNVLKRVADEVKLQKATKVVVEGHTDTVGTPAYNQTLSESRARVVRDYLIDHGVTAKSITTVGYGETKLRVPTADGVKTAENRFARITLGK